MTKFASRMMMAAAAASVAFAPIAAQAGTRASDNGAVYAAGAQGVFGDDDDEGGFDFGGIVLGFAALALIGAGIFFATDTDDKGQSPGT
jgi:hypothetical protein